MIAYNVEFEASRYVVRVAPNHAPTITRDGEPASFLPGWTPKMLLGDLGNVSILEVVHADGTRAVWYLDARFGFISNNISDLDDSARATLLKVARRSMKLAWQQLGGSTTPALDPALACELRMLREFVAEAAAGPWESMLVPADVVRLDDDSCATLAARLAGQVPNVAATIAILHQILERDFFKDVVAAAATDKLEVASPVDGRRLTTDVGLCLRPGTIAYRFIDPAHDLTFYVLGSFWRITLAAIYIPRFNLTIQRNALNEQYISEFLGEPVDRAVFSHVMTYADDLLPYFAAPSRVMSLIYTQNHLGHHLFNELGGLDRVVAAMPPERIPSVLMVNADHSEMYGKLEEIFPQLRDKVDRTPRNPEQVTRFAYQNLRCLLRPTDDYVSSALARRIIELNERAPSLDADKALFAELSASRTLIVMLGLRVENRTVVDPTGFFADVIGTLRQFGKLAVVFDGHNGILGDEGRRTYESHMEDEAVKAPAEVEADVVRAIRDRYDGDSGITVVSTVGAPMSASIYWCNRAAFFVTPWGAGLAKYRWVCNRPGLVVAGQRFLRHAGEETIHLYDSDEIMEAPTPLSFVTEDEVIDDVDAPFLVGIKDDNRVNFTVRPEALRARVLSLVPRSFATLSGNATDKL